MQPLSFLSLVLSARRGRGWGEHPGDQPPHQTSIYSIKKKKPHTDGLHSVEILGNCIEYRIGLKIRNLRSSLVAQWVKDLALLLL